jgi:hypothetical protein
VSQPPFQILLPTDVFPPRAGGAGWSAHALALALIARGHHVTAVVPRQGRPGVMREDVLGVPTLRWGYQAPRIPFVQNYFRHERLWPRLADALMYEIRDWRLEIGDWPGAISNLQSPISSTRMSASRGHSRSWRK